MNKVEYLLRALDVQFGYKDKIKSSFKKRSEGNDHGVDMGLFWAQMKHVWMNGSDHVNSELTAERHWLMDEELKMMTLANEHHKAVNPVIERFVSRFGNPYDSDGSVIVDAKDVLSMNATEILIEIGIDNPTPTQTRTLAAYLKNQDFTRRKDDKRFKVAEIDDIPTMRAIDGGKMNKVRRVLGEY